MFKGLFWIFLSLFVLFTHAADEGTILIDDPKTIAAARVLWELPWSNETMFESRLARLRLQASEFLKRQSAARDEVALKDGVADLLEDTRIKLASVESRVVQELARELKLEDLVLLSEFGRTPNGIIFFRAYGKGKIAESSLESFANARNDRISIEKIRLAYSSFPIAWVESNLKFAELASGLAKDFDRRLAELTEKYGPGAFFQEPVQGQDPERVGFLVPPFPSTEAYMKDRGIESGTFELGKPGGPSRLGDFVWALVTYADGSPKQQWLVRWERVANTKEETLRQPTRRTKYTTFGGEYHFESGPQAVEIEVVGPFSNNRNRSSAESSKERILLRRDFLDLGFNRVAEFQIRMEQMVDRPQTKWRLGSSGRPFGEERLQDSALMKEFYGVTEAEDRAFSGYTLAVGEFYSIGMKTPVLKKLLVKVLRFSDLIAMARSQPVSYLLELNHREEPGLAFSGNDSVYSLPLTLLLDKKPTLKFRFFAVEPTPPLNVVAGLYGAIIASPDDDRKRIVVRLLQGQLGEADAIALSPDFPR